MVATLIRSDHVRWHSEAEWVGGKIIKRRTNDTEYEGCTQRASVDEPQYEMQNDTTQPAALHNTVS